MLNYRWEGNVREIKNTVERIVLLEEGERIERNHLSFLVPAQAAENAGSDAAPRLTAGGVDLVEINKSLVFKALEMTGGNKAEAAKLLGISRPTLVYRLNKYRSES